MAESIKKPPALRFSKWFRMLAICVALLILGILSLAAITVYYMGSYDKKIDFISRSNETSPLIGNFRSYTSVEEVKNKLNNDGYHFTEKEERANTLPGERPPFHIVILKVNNYKNLDSEGILELYFLNDRLSQAVFYPEDSDKYWNQLTQEKSSKITIPPYTTIERYPEAISPPLKSDIPKRIRFFDERLREEQSIWIMRYS